MQIYAFELSLVIEYEQEEESWLELFIDLVFG